MPDWKREISERLRGLSLSPLQEAEIIEELAQHLDDVYHRAISSGANEADANRAALNELAGELKGIQRYKRQPQAHQLADESGRLNLLADFLQDLRYAARMLAKVL